MKKKHNIFLVLCITMSANRAMEIDTDCEITDNNLKLVTSDNHVFYFPQALIKISSLNDTSYKAANNYQMDPIQIEDMSSSDLKKLMPFLWLVIQLEPKDRKSILYQMVKARYSLAKRKVKQIEKLLILADKIDFKDLVAASAKFYASMIRGGRLKTNIKNRHLLTTIASYYFLLFKKSPIFRLSEEELKISPKLPFSTVFEECGKEIIVGNSQKTEELDLYNMNLSDIIGLEAIDEVKNIKQLRIKKNYLSDDLPQLASFKDLELLFLTHNSFINIPHTLSLLLNLRELYLNANSIAKIDDTLMYLTHLKVLNIAGNRLMEFPQCPPGIEELNLAKNLITEIPDTIATLKKLSILYINQNQLSTISHSIQTLKGSLKKINLQKNKLTNKTLHDISILLPRTLILEGAQKP